MTNESEDALNRARSSLSEHFQNVLIIVTERTSDGQTQLHRRSSGDYYASLGMAHEFIKDNESISIAREISRVMKND